MNVWLLRHGIAERHSADPDAERQLTEKGRKKLSMRIPEYKKLIGPDPIIWTSPLTRARQTAEMLASAYGGSEIAEIEALAEGDHESLYHMLKMIDPKRSYVLVGHEPYLSDFYKVMTDLTIDLKQGALIGFRFPNEFKT